MSDGTVDSADARRPRVVVLSTLDAGLDAVAHVLRSGHRIDLIVGVAPSSAATGSISGWTDVAEFGRRWGVPHHYVDRYDLDSQIDREYFAGLQFDFLWVCGWQRLVPAWLLGAASRGAIGAHGSPDGVAAGRGRSPQNWAIMLGCPSFEVALFRLTSGVDDGPIISSRTFHYGIADDVAMSYRKNAFCVGEMLVELLDDPDMVDRAQPQGSEAYYFPQRTPEDGVVDWRLPVAQVWAHCRALSRPYPGLRAFRAEGGQIVIWGCEPFDAATSVGRPGRIDAVFEDGSFVVECGDGRLLVHDCDAPDGWKPSVGEVLVGRPFLDTLREICDRHVVRHPDQPLSPRIRRLLDGAGTA